MRVWDKRSGECKVTFEGHTGRVYAFCEVDGGERIVSGGADKTVRLWNALSGECALTFEGHAGTVWSVCMADSGKRSGLCSLMLEGHKAAVFSVLHVKRRPTHCERQRRRKTVVCVSDSRLGRSR